MGQISRNYFSSVLCLHKKNQLLEVLEGSLAVLRGRETLSFVSLRVDFYFHIYIYIHIKGIVLPCLLWESRFRRAERVVFGRFGKICCMDVESATRICIWIYKGLSLECDWSRAHPLSVGTWLCWCWTPGRWEILNSMEGHSFVLDEEREHFRHSSNMLSDCFDAVWSLRVSFHPVCFPKGYC